MDLVDKYNHLNNSFQKKLIFRIGSSAGFFSEYNNMILAMLYCLQHKIKFALSSVNANFAYDKGWTDYFLPFCEEDTSAFHVQYNKRNYPELPVDFNTIEKFKIKLYKFRNKDTYFTQDLWVKLRNREIESSHFCIPELGIDGDLRNACKTLIELTWRFNSKSTLLIRKKIESLNLPSKYIGLHLRGGDKYLEGDLFSIDTYINKAEQLSDTNVFFVLTDDYRIFKSLENRYPLNKYSTFCEKDEHGYNFNELVQNEKNVIYKAHMNLFSSIEILKDSDYFIGTFSSNIGMFLGMIRDREKTVGVDFDDWQIW